MGARIWGSFIPDRIISGITARIKPFVQSRFSIAGHESMIIIVPLTAHQMKNLPKRFVKKRLLDACNLAHDEGVGIMSLGAYTAIASNQGADLVSESPVALTTGRACTVYAVMEQARPYFTEDSKIAIIGGDGAIGSAVAQLSGQYDIVRVNRENIGEVYSADIIISVSSTIGNVIYPEKLKTGAVVLDAAKPSDISRIITREDISILDGGVVQVPGEVDFGIDFDLGKNQVYACMAEAFILGMSGHDKHFCVGKDFDLELVDRIGKLAKEKGFLV